MVGRMFFAEQCEGSDKVNTWREGILGSEDRCFTSEKYHNNNVTGEKSTLALFMSQSTWQCVVMIENLSRGLKCQHMIVNKPDAKCLLYKDVFSSFCRREQKF